MDIQLLDSLDHKSKSHALACLEKRYQHIRKLTAEVKRVNKASQAFRTDADLYNVIFSVQQQTAEALEASSARLLMMDEAAGRLWALEGTAGEAERVFVKLGVGITGACIESQKPIVVESCATDDRFDPLVDSPAANLVVNNVMVMPVVHPYNSSKLLAVLQAHNHKGGTMPFTARDHMVGHLLSEQAGIALKSGMDFHSWSTREKVMHRIRGVGSSLMQILHLQQLVQAIQRAGCDLFKATSVAVYLVDHKVAAEGAADASNAKDYDLKPGFNTNQTPLESSWPSYELLRAVVDDGVAMRVSDVKKEPRFTDKPTSPHLRPHTLMVQDLRNTAGLITGVVEVRRDWAFRANATKPESFSWEDSEALGMLCSLAAVALENARLAELCELSVGRVLEVASTVCSDGLLAATPKILEKVNAAVPCKLAQLHLRLEDTQEAWAYDSTNSSEEKGSSVGSSWQMSSGGPVVAAFKYRRTSVQQCGGTPMRSGSPKRAERPKGGAVKSKANLAVGPHPAVYVAEEKASACVKHPSVAAEDVKYALTAPATSQDGAPIVAALQLVNKKDGRPFTQQDEYLLRGVASEVAVMVETAQQATDSTAASSRLDDLVGFIDALGQKTTVPGEAGFEEWLASEIKKAVVCDSFCALWHNEESKTLKDTLKGHEIGVAPAGEEAKQQSTGHITAQQEQGAERYIQSANADRRTIYHVGPPTSHLCIPVISHIRPGAAAYGVLHLEGSNTRSEALGTTAFYKNERRFVEDLAAHLGLFMDAQSVAMGGAAALSHRSSV